MGVPRMPGVKVRKIKKGSEYFPCVLGLHILQLLKSGYHKYEIYDRGDEIEIRTWRIRTKEEGR